ncbi:MAG: hypothetical protein WCI02_19025 [Planctomycetota bacterium]
MSEVRNPKSLPERWSVSAVRADRLEHFPDHLPQSPLIGLPELKPWGGHQAADPFGIERNGAWYIFFEMMRKGEPNAVISVARSQDLASAAVLGVALEPGHHLSYPFVFEHEGQTYMMPESKKKRRIDVYRAIDFPLVWAFDRTVLRGRYMDASIFYWNNRYWLFAGWGSYWLRVFHSTSPLGPWKSLVQPIARIYNKRNVRPGGKTVRYQGQLLRFVQDCQKYYGHQLRAMRIKTLNRFFYREVPWRPDPFFQPGHAHWCGAAMHHLDAHCRGEEWIGFIDGACPQEE